ncbi:hypothetical protein KCP75_24955 [Salmonella enterica subsp. enterica]|nr:hypothetical protein KCP75_24955 [Salmonella enterica subsp. enterica]
MTLLFPPRCAITCAGVRVGISGVITRTIARHSWLSDPETATLISRASLPVYRRLLLRDDRDDSRALHKEGTRNG